MSKILVGLSGGIDSTFSAYLLKKQGYDVIGCFLLTDFNAGLLEKVKQITNHLNVQLIVEDVRELFKQKVVDYFVSSYLNALTPNPCIVCNTVVKFYKLSLLARKLSATAIATGHYVRKVKVFDKWTVACARDNSKDQSYFLANLCGQDLSCYYFPLGAYTKSYVKKAVYEIMPSELFFRESQDLCFIYNKNYRHFLTKQAQQINVPGNIVNTKGIVLGKHQGLHYFTPGQREGLSIEKTGPWYVVELRKDTNELVVAHKSEALFRALKARNLRWILPETGLVVLNAKIRYNQPNILVKVYIQKERDYVTVEFNRPVLGVAPGQYIVFYRNGIVVGGAEIVEGYRDEHKTRNSKT